jgi:phosphatidylglycerol:prolipoprotein diacylglycerol transferase
MDIAAPAVFVMQAVARWGNFFNQELYGPPTNLPWGIAIDCAHRVAEYACPPGSLPTDTLGQHFQPMFLYESLSGLAGALTLLWLGRRFAGRLRPGDLAMIFIIWYSTVRFGLEYLRAGYNWTFFGVPTAQVVAGSFIIGAVAVLIWRHRPGAADAERAKAAALALDESGTHAADSPGDAEPDEDGRRPTESGAPSAPPA